MSVSMRGRRTAAVAILLVMVLPSCGVSPTSPRGKAQPKVPPPGPLTYHIMANVRTPDGLGVAGATLEIIEGQGTGQVFTTDDGGKITLTDVQGNVRILAASWKCENDRQSVSPPQAHFPSTYVNFTLRTKKIWEKRGQGSDHFDMPRCVDRVRIIGIYNGHGTNFIVQIEGRPVVGELLGTYWGQTQYSGVHLTNGGKVEIVQSSGVAWSFKQLR